MGTGSSVTGSRDQYFMMASNLSPCEYFFSRSLRAAISHSGGGGYNGSNVSQVIHENKRI